MKILHLCLACFYIDGYSYQENLLPKYHKKMGHQVKILASLMSFDENGDRCFLPEPTEYQNEDGITVQRLNYKNPRKIGKLFRKYEGTYEALCQYEPELIFIHGVQFSDIYWVVKYIKSHPQTVVYVDNHSDFSNSANNWVSKNIQHKIIWKHYAQMINPYVKRFYGVLPARVDFLVNMYGLPKEKVELLVMGVDDEYVKQAERAGIGIREQYGIAGDDFLIINGGKIDRWKPQTLFLMEAVNRISDPKVKLIVFGSVTEELRQKVLERCSDRVQYIGWVQSADSYKYFAAGNLAVFPGRHSVFWEQVAGQGIPMLVKYWNGTTHIDYGGNVRFLYKDSAEEIQRSIEETISLPTYAAMKKAAINAKEQFLYSRIAERSIR